MDIWEKLCHAAAKEFRPRDVTPFIYAHHVVCALESENGEIYTGFCIESCGGVMNLCAERVAALSMYQQSGQTTVKRLVCFRDTLPSGNGFTPCGACREFFMQLSPDNKDMEILLDFDSRKTTTLNALLPDWWGRERYNQ